MEKPIDQHLIEIDANRSAWDKKPLLKDIYTRLYQRILSSMDSRIPGEALEIGSGMGNLKSHLPQAICSDLFPNPWLDLVCDGYELPFRNGSLSHLILFDVFHHLQAPMAFLQEAHRVLNDRGRLIILDPYISLASWPVYGIAHHEPVGWGKQIDDTKSFPRPRPYYAAQGNATRLFFRGQFFDQSQRWRSLKTEAFPCFAYFASGGFSKSPMLPTAMFHWLHKVDALLAPWPRLFAGRCLICLEKGT